MNASASIENTRGEVELLKQGWTRQFLASGSRLQEASTSYPSIGLEVHLEPAQSKDLACSECQPPATIRHRRGLIRYLHSAKKWREERAQRDG